MSEIHKRRIAAYPHPKYFKMFIASCDIECVKPARLASEIITNHFKQLPETEQKKLLEHYPEVAKNKNSY